MGNTMSSALLLTVKLKGQVKGQEKHTDKQIVTVDVTPVGSKHPEFMSRKIKHNDRSETECNRKIKISEDLVHEWENSECPHWEKPGTWKSMTKMQKLISHLKRFDEGYGISFDFIENK